MKRVFRLLAAIVIVCLATAAARADTVYLKNGRKFEGKASIEGDMVVVELRRGKISFAKAEVDRIERGPAPWETYETRARALKGDDAAGHLALARWCREKNLLTEMGKELEAVLAADPDNAEARRILKHEKVDGKWLTRTEALEARGYHLVNGKWLTAAEYAAHQAKEGAAEALEKEKKLLEDLGEADAEKAAAARKHYVDLGEKALGNLTWGLMKAKKPKARQECARLIHEIGFGEDTRYSLWLAQQACRETDAKVIEEICRGIKSRKDEVALTYLVYVAAMENSHRRRAASCLKILGDTRAFRALIGCVVAAPKNTLPGQMGMNLEQMGKMASTGAGGGAGVQMGEVVPPADSLECISGMEYKNDVSKWLKWVESLEKADGGAVIAPGKAK